MGWKVTTLVVMATVAFNMMCSTVTAERQVPPEITKPGSRWSKPDRYLRKGSNMTIDCEADGNPKPEFMWLMDKGNGMYVEVKNSDRVKYNKTTGKLLATKKFEPKDDNSFICVAYNPLGKAMTSPVTVQIAIMNSFPGSPGQPPEEIRAFVSESLKLECKNANSVGGAPFTRLWQRKRINEDKFTSVTIEQNMAMDPAGHLHFLWVEKKDFDYIYVCAADFPDLIVVAANTHSYYLKQRAGQAVERNPSLVYKSDVTGLAGTTAELVCIYTYYSSSNTPLVINWFHKRQTLDQEGQVLNVAVKVPDAKQNVSGEYTCTAVLGDASRSEDLTLTVIAAPKFIAKPVAKTVPVGSDAVLNCDTSSYKTYQDAPIWYKDTEKLLDCADPSKMPCTERMDDGSLKCVPRCDGRIDCNNEEDEAQCVRGCSEGNKLCRGKCIGVDATCSELPCEWPSYLCKDDTACILEGQVCDGVEDCRDGSDELYCPDREPIVVKRFVVSSDRKTLTLPQVTLNDNACFQCSVKNQHGSVFASGCLDVIDRIEVFPTPNGTYNVQPGTFLNIGVDATTDRNFANKMTFEWIMYNETKDEDGNPVTKIVKYPFHPYGQYFGMAGSGKNLTITVPIVSEEDANQDNYNAYEAITRDRLYGLNVSNSIEVVIVNFTLIGAGITKPVPVPIVESASTNLWLIALILAILILIVVIVLIVCYMHRNRGGTYPLDKKEHQAGHDPAQELKDSAFMDVGRVDDDDDDDKPRDQVSLSDSIKYESDDDITGEYDDDINLDKYREEGSFIFQYGDKKKGAKEATV